MSDDSYLMSAELTIDLDDDVLPEVREDTATPVAEEPQKENSLYKPIKLDKVKIVVPDTCRITDISDEARVLLADQMDLPQIGTFQNWKSIAGIFGASSDVIMNMEREKQPTLTFLERYGSKPLSELIEALENMYRIDTLFDLKRFHDDKSLLKETIDIPTKKKKRVPAAPDYSSASTSIDLQHTSTENSETAATASSQPKNFVLDPSLPVILVVHYSKSKEERKIIRWFFKYLDQANAKADDQFKKNTVDFQEIVSDTNIGESIEKAFRQADSIVFCFTPSLIELLDSEAKDDRKGKYAKIALNSARDEYYSNNSINKRFRPVHFEDCSPQLPTIGWTAATLIYKFPSGFQALAERLFNPKNYQ